MCLDCCPLHFHTTARSKDFLFFNPPRPRLINQETSPLTTHDNPSIRQKIYISQPTYYKDGISLNINIISPAVFFSALSYFQPPRAHISDRYARIRPSRATRSLSPCGVVPIRLASRTSIIHRGNRRSRAV